MAPAVVPTCPTCDSTRWVAREESVCTRYRVLWSDEIPDEQPWTVESDWDPSGHKYQNEALTCSNGHEPDEALMGRVWDLLATAEYTSEEEVTSEDMNAVDGGLELDRQILEGGSR